jgi:prepilin peptidase CpaA
MISSLAAWVFLPFVALIGIWVAWSDMRAMKIPNQAVIALYVVWILPGLLVVPFHAWLWGCALAVIVLVAGFILNMTGAMGAGDAKFASAMAPFFVGADIRLVLGLMAACLLGAFTAHRLARVIPPLRRVAPAWESWTHDDFPMGLALSGMLLIALLFAALH